MLGVFFVLALLTPQRIAYAQGPQTLNGSFVLRQSDIAGECNFSDAPETTGSFTLTLDAGAGTASGSLQGGGSGTRGLACSNASPATTAQMDWQQNFSATFTGSFNSANGEISMSGTLDGTNNVDFRNCTSGFQEVDCQADLGVNDYAVPYQFPIALNGTYVAGKNSASGTWTVSPIVRPTSGEWTVQGAAPSPQPTSVPPTNIPPTANVPAQPTPTIPAATLAPGAPLVSDNFDRPDAPACGIGPAQNGYGGNRSLYFLPIFPTGGTDATNPIGVKLANGALENNGLDYGGFQFALSDACAVARGVVRGADMGQALNIRADLLVPTNAAGHVTQAGPYVRSRAAALGDGIIGGESAGYWAQLESTGEIKIKRLNPNAVIAFTARPASFDARAIHIIEIAAGGNQLQVALDGRLQTFNQDNQFVTAVNIPPTAGSNQGAAGIAFGAEANRGQIGGQRADNIVVTAYRPLDGLPVQNNFANANTATPIPTTPLITATAAATAAANASPTATATVMATTIANLTPTLIASNALAGDCDNDARLSELDALCALEMSVSLRASMAQMDLDGDGIVTSRDAVLLLQRALNR
jgi:hypothetical protein